MLKGRELPTWYLEEPPYSADDSFYLNAFWDLSTCRALGTSEGPIPWTATVEFADRAGLDREVTGLFESVIRAMDIAYLGWREAEYRRSRRLKGDGGGG